MFYDVIISIINHSICFVQVYQVSQRLTVIDSKLWRGNKRPGFSA